MLSGIEIFIFLVSDHLKDISMAFVGSGINCPWVMGTDVPSYLYLEKLNTFTMIL